MVNVFRLVIVGAILVLCVAAASGVYFGIENNQLRETLAPENVKLDSGVFVQPAVVKSVFGEKTPVSVHASPVGSDTAGAKSVAVDGTINLWVPTTFVGSAASLTPSEVQEYVIRELAACSDKECVFDTANTPLDAGTLSAMAADENVKRTGETSEMFGKFVEAENFRYALDKQAEVATHGMDRIRDVAVSGDAAQTAAVGFNALSTTVISLAIIAVVVLVVFLVLKGIVGKGPNYYEG